MKPSEFLEQMKSILADERDAIRRLDVKGVMEAGARKERLLESVRDVHDKDKRQLSSALVEVRGELRRNLVLLAHARDYLRDAINLCTQTKKAARPRLLASL